MTFDYMVDVLVSQCNSGCDKRFHRFDCMGPIGKMLVEKEIAEKSLFASDYVRYIKEGEGRLCFCKFQYGIFRGCVITETTNVLKNIKNILL
jgi:hypothetical protein